MSTSDFNFIFLGQSVLRYKVPLDVFHTINDIYEKRRHELYPANKQLVGKIEKEHSLFYEPSRWQRQVCRAFGQTSGC